MCKVSSLRESAERWCRGTYQWFPDAHFQLKHSSRNVSVARQRRVVDVGGGSDEESSWSRKVPGRAVSAPRFRSHVMRLDQD